VKTVSIQSPRILAHLAWIRLGEHPVRTTMLVVTIGVTVLAWVVLSAFASPFLVSQAEKKLNANLGILNARVETAPMPVRYAHQIEQIPGVVGVIYTTVAAFACADEKTAVSVNAYGGSNIAPYLRHEAGTISDADLAAWNDTRNGLLVDAALAHQCGLTPGMTISPQDVVSGVEMPFHIIALFPGNSGPYAGQLAFGHYDYINQMVPEDQRDQTRFIRVTGDDPAHLPQLAQTIEREFASADPPVNANISQGTSSMLGRFGQVQELLGVVMAAMAACALLVFLTVMAHQIAQRRSSMAALQTIGFDRRVQLGGLVLELAAIIIAGTVLGALSGYIALALINPQVFWLTGQLRTPDWALWSLAPALILLALLTLAWPALQVSKLKPIDHLRV